VVCDALGIGVYFAFMVWAEKEGLKKKQKFPKRISG
jgi:hypothetical protein